MEEAYWTGRKRAAMSMARNASTAEARLIHYEMAGRYSFKADHSLPFVAATTTAPESKRETLRIVTPAPQPIDGPARGGGER